MPGGVVSGSQNLNEMGGRRRFTAQGRSPEGHLIGGGGMFYRERAKIGRNNGHGGSGLPERSEPANNCHRDDRGGAASEGYASPPTPWRKLDDRRRAIGNVLKPREKVKGWRRARRTRQSRSDVALHIERIAT